MGSLARKKGRRTKKEQEARARQKVADADKMALVAPGEGKLPAPRSKTKPTLGSLADVFAPLGSPDTIMAIAALDEDDRMKEMVDRWELFAPQDKKRTAVLEGLCEMAGVSPSWFLGRMVELAHRYGQGKASIIASSVAPEIVRAAVASAMEPDGFKDRQMLLQHIGLVEKSKGITIQQNQVNVNATPPSFESAINVVDEAARKKLPGRVIDVKASDL